MTGTPTGSTLITCYLWPDPLLMFSKWKFLGKQLTRSGNCLEIIPEEKLFKVQASLALKREHMRWGRDRGNLSAAFKYMNGLMWETLDLVYVAPVGGITHNDWK